MEASGFRYQPLSEADSIRLLLLEASEQSEADLRGRLVHTTITDCDKNIYNGYIAISYVWGNPAEKGAIILNDELVTLSASLDAALRGVRHTTIPCFVWADAVCIDQGNMAERSHQVSLMGSIYSHASHTVIFLGSLTPEAEAVLSMADLSPDVSEDDRAKAFALAERDILRRPWFTRTWVFQELVLSKDPWVQCGRQRARWTSLCSLLCGSDGAPRVLSAMDAARSSFSQNKTTLLGLLSARREARATDPRDLVYGLLGMLPESERLPNRVVDYTLPVAKVYTKAAGYILERSSIAPRPDHLEQLLQQAEATLLRHKGVWNLPSWVPDWSLPELTTPLPNSYIGPCFEKLWSKHEMSQWWAFVEEPEILLCFGSRPYEWHRSSQCSVDALLSPVFPPPSTLPLELREQCLANLQNLFPTLHSSIEATILPPEYLETFTVLWDAIHASQNGEGMNETIEPYRHEGLQELIRHARYTSDSRAASQLIISYLGGEVPRISWDYQDISTWFQDGDTAYPLVGRRLASVNGILAVVPCHTRTGDKVMPLLPSGRLYVIREELDVKSLRSAWEEGLIQKAGSMANKERIQGSVDIWGRVVGECVLHCAVTNELGQGYSEYDLCVIALL